MSDKHRQHLANAAESVLSSPAYREACDAIESTLIERLVALDCTHREEEHEVVNLLRASRLHQTMLKGILATGDSEDLNKLARNSVT